MKKPGRLFTLVIVVLALGIVLTLLNIYELHKMRETGNLQQAVQPQAEGKPGKYAVRTPIVWVEGKKVQENTVVLIWVMDMPPGSPSRLNWLIWLHDQMIHYYFECNVSKFSFDFEVLLISLYFQKFYNLYRNFWTGGYISCQRALKFENKRLFQLQIEENLAILCVHHVAYYNQSTPEALVDWTVNTVSVLYLTCTIFCGIWFISKLVWIWFN